MDIVAKFTEILGLTNLSPLVLYGTMSSILFASIVVGVTAQVWKARTGGAWAFLALFLLIGGWLGVHNALDPALYAIPGGGEAGWGVLALGVSLGGGLLLLIVVATLPSHKSRIERVEPPALPKEDSHLSAEPITPILPRSPRHKLRRRLFGPMIFLGVAAFIAAGLLSVEKKQLDIFMRYLGIAPPLPPPPEPKVTAPKGSKATVKPKPVPRDPTISRVQKLLLELGYDVGVADGVAGGKTDDAVREFQSAEGLPRNGQVSQDLIKHLEIAKNRRVLMAGKIPLSPEFEPHADMCKRGVRAWFRSRTTKLQIEGVTQTVEKLSANITVWFSYPGEELERVRGTALCQYSRYRDEMPEQPFAVTVKIEGLEEILDDREIACFSEGQPC